MRPTHRTAVVLLAGTLAACSDHQPTTPAVDPMAAAAISDGANDGNPHFFFLNPLVPAPNPTGLFDATAEPEVEICPLDGAGDCLAAIALYTTGAGHASETIRVSTDDEHYIVNWHSGDFDLDPEVTYRIRVLLRGLELGYADVDVVTSGRDLRNVATDEFIPLKDGRTLPIKFRIEEGALAAGAPSPLATGYDHTCALDDSGAAWCWGSNAYGQLGNGTTTNAFQPTPVAGGLTFRAIEVGTYLTCGVTIAGDGYCWGYNQWGQTGVGTAGGNLMVPTLVAGGRQWQSLAPAREFACGLSAGGEVWCWGNNTRGALGRGFFSFQEVTPGPVAGALVFAEVRAFGTSVCALTEGGEAHCWGGNAFGTLGDGTFANRNEPTAVVGGLSFASIDAGLLSTCGVTTSGAGYCWGQNDFGELGTGAFTTADLPTPQAVTGGHVFREIRTGFAHACGVTVSGEGLCWGLNAFGALGIGSVTGAQATPQVVVGGHTWERIDAGFRFSCGETTDAQVYCWGENTVGALGDGTGVNRPSPVLALNRTP